MGFVIEGIDINRLTDADIHLKDFTIHGSADGGALNSCSDYFHCGFRFFHLCLSKLCSKVTLVEFIFTHGPFVFEVLVERKLRGLILKVGIGHIPLLHGFFILRK